MLFPFPFICRSSVIEHDWTDLSTLETELRIERARGVSAACSDEERECHAVVPALFQVLMVYANFPTEGVVAIDCSALVWHGTVSVCTSAV